MLRPRARGAAPTATSTGARSMRCDCGRRCRSPPAGRSAAGASPACTATTSRPTSRTDHPPPPASGGLAPAATRGRCRADDRPQPQGPAPHDRLHPPARHTTLTRRLKITSVPKIPPPPARDTQPCPPPDDAANWTDRPTSDKQVIPQAWFDGMRARVAAPGVWTARGGPSTLRPTTPRPPTPGLYPMSNEDRRARVR